MCNILIMSKLKVKNQQFTNQDMHNIKSNFDKILETIKSLPLNIFNDKGSVKRPGPTSKSSDLEVVSLNIVSEYMSIDSENFLFKKIASCHKDDFPNIIERSQYNKKKKNLFPTSTRSGCNLPLASYIQN